MLLKACNLRAHHQLSCDNDVCLSASLNGGVLCIVIVDTMCTCICLLGELMSAGQTESKASFLAELESIASLVRFTVNCMVAPLSTCCTTKLAVVSCRPMIKLAAASVGNITIPYTIRSTL